MTADEQMRVTALEASVRVTPVIAKDNSEAVKAAAEKFYEFLKAGSDD